MLDSLRKNSCILSSYEHEPSASGHGGNRRALQIKELLLSLEIPLIPLNPNSTTSSKFSKIFNYLGSLPASVKECGFHGKTSVRDWAYLRAVRLFISNLDRQYYIKALLWENTQDLGLVKAVSNAANIVAIPQNIESLVASPPKRSSSSIECALDRLKDEAITLASCHSIFTISSYDSWLLSNLGIPSYLLPYWPPLAIERECLAVRTARSKKQPTHSYIIILGTIANGPTLDGMLSLLNFMLPVLKDKSTELKVVGYGTNALSSYFSSDNNLTIHGSVSDSHLQILLTSCSYVVIHQNYGTGSLTKLPELLLSGVPVIASQIAARGYENYNGIQTYCDLHCLPKMISENPNVVPDIPPRNFAAEKFFIDHMAAF
jgi:hypothetical protein